MQARYSDSPGHCAWKQIAQKDLWAQSRLWVTHPLSGPVALGVAALGWGGLETWLHAFYLNSGVLVTPFHTMFLMCPATSDADVETHSQAFAAFVETAIAEGAVAP